MFTIISRETFTPWKIVIIDRGVPHKTMEENTIEGGNCFEYMEFSCTYRTTMKNGRECDQFTMMPEDDAYALLQIQIFKNGDINSFNVIPSEISVNKKEKRIDIRLLCYCEIVRETGNYLFTPDREVLNDVITLERNGFSNI